MICTDRAAHSVTPPIPTRRPPPRSTSSAALNATANHPNHPVVTAAGVLLSSSSPSSSSAAATAMQQQPSLAAGSSPIGILVHISLSKNMSQRLFASRCRTQLARWPTRRQPRRHVIFVGRCFAFVSLLPFLNLSFFSFDFHSVAADWTRQSSATGLVFIVDLFVFSDFTKRNSYFIGVVERKTKHKLKIT